MTTTTTPASASDMDKPKSPPCRYTVVSDGEIVARFQLFADIEFFIRAADDAGLFGELGAVAYGPKGEYIGEAAPHPKSLTPTSRKES